MKNHTFRRPRGFTLVELLVVIAIIAVLASAGFAAGNAAMQRARRTAALATAIAIETAVNSFYTEYGSMPVKGVGEVKIQTDNAEGRDLLRALLGMEKDQSPRNSRSIKFLTVKEGKGNKNGLIYTRDGGDITGLYDPWGGPFYVLMDLEYKERIKIPDKVKDGDRDLNGRRVAVWSLGVDSSEDKKTDDVITWGN